MQFHLAMAVAALIAALLLSSGANAFETTSIGGVSADGSAKYQDPDELGAALTTPSTSANSWPFSNFNFSAGSTADNSNNSTTQWLNGPGSPGFGFTGSGSQSTAAEPPSPFNTPILRERN